MKIKSLTIHNFRSIKEVKFNLEDYVILVGANNAGKSNILTALRIFYEDEIKFNEKSDFPKFQTEDNESWIEIEYLLTQEEFISLKEEYKNPNRVLKEKLIKVIYMVMRMQFFQKIYFMVQKIFHKLS